MCGIIGFCGLTPESKWHETYRVLNSLLLAAECRGKDAAGFVALAEPFKRSHRQSVVFEKQPLRASQFVNVSSAWQTLRGRRATIVVGHTRLATHGAAEDGINAHPHCGDDGYYLVHNGVIANHRDLAQKYQCRLVSETDSEVLLRVIEQYSEPTAGLRACLRDVKGSMAVAVYDQRRRMIWLARNAGSPLVLARTMDRRWFFASTPAILEQGLKAAWGEGSIDLDVLIPLPPFVVCSLSPDGALRSWG